MSDTTNASLLARSDKLVRWGAVVPFGGLCLISVTARLTDLSRTVFVAEMLSLSCAGQLLVWLGMHGLRRSRGWDSGVLFYVWLGGLMNALAVASTGIVYLAPIPLLAPATAWLAKVRLRRKPPAEAAR
ncbi:hypothetical protein [Streptomyces sp. NPDC008139]|uniref:hypothetical protein n=1 Tax=Streptomyces sp. NPDC008139 TaxID=3364814 RepID=UPI0036DFC3EC